MNVFLGVPCRGTVDKETTLALTQASRDHTVKISLRSSSSLTLNFNSLWCEALNMKPRPAYFAMLHDDVAPVAQAENWLDALIRELDRVGGDVLSLVLPIKDDRGFTSTAYWHPHTGRMKRLTMNEIARMPVTFSGMDIPDLNPHWYILPNTGLFVCRFGGWQWPERICFTMRDRITMDRNGNFTAHCFTEDWDFGVQCYNLDLKVFATRGIMATHRGQRDFVNFHPWGSMETDTESVLWDPPQRQYGDR